MKKIAGILLIIFLSLHAIAQNMDPPKGEGFFPHWLAKGWLTYLALLFAIIVIGLYLFRSRRPSKSRGHGLIAPSNNELQQDINWLKNALNKKANQSDLDKMVEKFKLIEANVDQTKSPIREKEWDVEKKPIQDAEQESFSQVQTTGTVQELFFAKLADLDDGFSSGIIASLQNGEQVYEIQTTGDMAVYRISSDANAQKYALAESTFTLGKACELLNQPFKGCRIVLQEEGSLIKVSGNWIIQQKAKIEFK